MTGNDRIAIPGKERFFVVCPECGKEVRANRAVVAQSIAEAWESIGCRKCCAKVRGVVMEECLDGRVRFEQPAPVPDTMPCEVEPVREDLRKVMLAHRAAVRAMEEATNISSVGFYGDDEHTLQAMLGRTNKQSFTVRPPHPEDLKWSQARIDAMAGDNLVRDYWPINTPELWARRAAESLKHDTAFADILKGGGGSAKTFWTPRAIMRWNRVKGYISGVWRALCGKNSWED